MLLQGPRRPGKGLSGFSIQQGLRKFSLLYLGSEIHVISYLYPLKSASDSVLNEPSPESLTSQAFR